jgi:UDPglucose 6-dehydrogenase
VKKIGIIGHGFVGQAMERLFSSAFDIAIYDVATQPSPDDLRGSDLVLICVPTPMAADGSCDVRHVEAAVAVAVEYAPGALVCIKSAVPPGTTDRLSQEHNTDRIVVSPEYVGEGTRFVAPWKYPDPLDSRSHDFVIVGGPRASEVLDYFARVMAADARYVSCRAVEAELTKRFENAFLATKVTFVNEAARIAAAYGADWKAVRELWLLDSRIGRSHTSVFTDEPGYGGKCLPKDMSALIDEAEKAGVDARLLKSVRTTNDAIRAR